MTSDIEEKIKKPTHVKTSLGMCERVPNLLEDGYWEVYQWQVKERKNALKTN